MITSIELVDFLSHTNTKLEFENGVTVFVGENGAGKSSIIDAITFALFGQHTRRTNKGLVKRGSNQGFARINFAVNNKQFEAVRKIDSKGTLAAKLTEIIENERTEIAAGERRQFGESMTHKVEEIIGLDFEKLKIASIVQQGELNAIINAKPKEFKELLNAIIGIDKLDIASEAMKTVNREFREKIREQTGHDDTHIEVLSRDLEKYQKEITESKPQKEELQARKTTLQEKIQELGKKIETETPKIDKISQLESRKKELQAYAKEAISKVQQEIKENEHKIRDCKDCFDAVLLKEDLESKMKKTEEAVSDTAREIQEKTNQVTSLKEKLSLASKLQLKNNRCPVCDSYVDKLNPLFQEEHIRQEILKLQNEITSKEKERAVYEQKRKEFSEKLQKSRNAETTLRAYSIKNKEELIEIQKNIGIKKEKISLTVNGSLNEIATIDSHASMIFENISRLETETEGFDEREFASLRREANEKQLSLSQIDQEMGAISEKIAKGEKEIDAIAKTIDELKTVKDYVKNLNEIQTNIFSRDGPVATSLRSWALNTISAKASEHLRSLNTKIQRILLSEKARDISITCYSKKEDLELESLSGGEKVSVALALRLGMASLLGAASNLNLMILDEPTAHLDTERKKSLVGVLSQLNSNTRMQFLIITHDEEILEDSTVEQIYKFETSEEGSNVIAL